MHFTKVSSVVGEEKILTEFTALNMSLKISIKVKLKYDAYFVVKRCFP